MKKIENNTSVITNTKQIMGILYSRTPNPTPNPTDTFNIHDERDAMDRILEISEQKMNEGDYLKISKCLKVIHEAKTQNIVSSHKILNRSMIEPNAVYILTHDETIQIMRWRYKDYYEFCILNLEESIAEDQLLLRQTTHDKKVAWDRLKKDRTTETRQRHKQLVQKEKLIKAKINEIQKEIQKMDEILQDFNLGNYAQVHL